MKKTSIALLFGGKSAEHAISLRSAAAIYHHLDRDRFEPVLVYINRAGDWCLTRNDSFREAEYAGEPYASFLPWQGREAIAALDADIYFPVLHGPNGEDGRVQGLLEMAGKPFVGAGSFASALAMDKAVAKMLFARDGLAVADFLVFTRPDPQTACALVEERLQYPVFVKPCSLGSSVGIRKVTSADQLPAALELAFSYDNKVLVEKAIRMREIEVSVMGNEELLVSPPGELIPSREFYDYEDKYVLNQTRFEIPVRLGRELEETVRHTALRAYRSLFLNGMARVDLFLESGTQAVLVNEINTIPGFTEISMFPKLWQVQGISFTDLLSRLVDYGFEWCSRLKSNVDETAGR